MQYNSLSRRDFLKVTAVGMTSAILTACQPAAPAAPAVEEKEAEPQPKVEVKAEKPAEKLNLQFQTHSYAPLVSFTERKIEEYKEIEPNITWQYLATADDWSKLLANMAAGAGPDGFNQGDWMYPVFMKNEWLAPVPPESFGLASDQEVVSQFFPASTVALIQDGKLHGVGFEWQCSMLGYNMHLFEEVGLDPMHPPETWEEYLEYALKLTKWDAQGNIIRQGCDQTYEGIWTLIRYRPMMYQLGGRWLSEDGTKMVYDSPESKEALKWLIDLTVEHRVTMDGFEVPGVAGLNGSDYRGMWISGVHYPASLLKTYPDQVYQVDWNWGPHPTFKGKERVTGGWRWGLFCNSASEQKVETWKFIKFMVDDWWGVLFEVGYYPSLAGWDDSAQGKEALEEMPWLVGMKTDLDVAIPQPMTPYWNELMVPWNDGLDRLHAGEPFDETVEAMVAEGNKILAETTG